MIRFIKSDLKELSNPVLAKHKMSFFQCDSKDGYGYGDRFLGVTQPQLRELVKKYFNLNLTYAETLIQSKYHEERMLGLLILAKKYNISSSESEKIKIYNLYLKNFKHVNGWDLVDVTCPHVVGRHLMSRDRKILYTWIKSKHLWTRRIGMVANWWFIRKGDVSDVFKMAHLLLKDEHSLMHKAVGWMLREAGKKDIKKLKDFLKNYAHKMPRTMLRYSIERFPEKQRKLYLKQR